MFEDPWLKLMGNHQFKFKAREQQWSCSTSISFKRACADDPTRLNSIPSAQCTFGKEECLFCFGKQSADGNSCNDVFTPNSPLGLLPPCITTLGEACWNMFWVTEQLSEAHRVFWLKNFSQQWIYLFHVMTVSVNSSENILLHCDSYWVCLLIKLCY